MIAASTILVVAAMALLGIGLFQDGSGYIVASISASVVSFVFLVVGTVRERRKEAPAPALVQFGDTGATAVPTETAPTEAIPTDTPGPLILQEEFEEEEPPVFAPADEGAAARAPVRRVATRKPAARKPAVRKPAAKRPAAKKPPARTAAKSTAGKAAAKTGAKKPAARKPAAGKPAAKKPAARKPAARKPSTGRATKS